MTVRLCPPLCPSARRRRVRSCWVGVLLGLLAIAAPALAESPPPPGVVKIQCKDAAGRLSTGTGFVWPDKPLVVTALHVAAGCKALTVIVDKTRWSAELVKVLAKSDLAQLKLSLPSKTDPGATEAQLVALPKSDDALDNELKHVIWGYPCCDDPKLALEDKVRFGREGAELASFIGQENYDKEFGVEQGSAGAKASPIPHSKAQILKILSVIKQGHSGAPILQRDRIVGIADGGLQQGLSGLNWAIPASALSELSSSPESVAEYKKKKLGWPVLFSAEDHGEDQSVGLGQGNALSYVWSAAVEEVVATTTRDERDDIDEQVAHFQREVTTAPGDAGGNDEAPAADLSGLWHLADELATVQQEGSALSVTFGNEQAFVGTIKGPNVKLSGLEWGEGKLSNDRQTIRWKDESTWSRSRLVGKLDVYQDEETTALVAFPDDAERVLDPDTGMLKVTLPNQTAVTMYVMIRESGGGRAETEFIKKLLSLTPSERRPNSDPDVVTPDAEYREVDQEWYIPGSEADSPQATMLTSTKVLNGRFLGTAVVVPDESRLSEADAVRAKYLFRICTELSTFPEMESR